VDYSFGNWVGRRRKALDLTRQELAERVGCSLATIVKIESDERRPSRQIAELLVEHLEIEPEQRSLFIKIARQQKGIQSLDAVPPLSSSRPSTARESFHPGLPLPLTSLIGREHELRFIIQQIQDPACRLLTLKGSGGVGKTRLALEAAHRLHDEFRQGTVFVSLAGTNSVEFIVPAVADALGFSFSGNQDLKAQLFSYLKEKQILIVLDNLEHLLSGIEVLDELLACAPALKLVTTSREQLNLRTEWAFEVQGLPIPSRIELENVDANSAVALFLERAKQAKIDFRLTRSDLPFAERICQLVEGLPLGLELAATWVRMMSFSEISEEIERSIDFLTTAARDIPQRHRSIRAVFDQSWDLLSEEERQAMRRLSIFRGGFRRDAAQQVAGATLPLLSALVNKSLVKRNEMGRYDMHELLRQYAFERLQAEPTAHMAVQADHAVYYITLLDKSKSAIQSHHQTEALAELIPETDNIRAAWDFAVANCHLEMLQRGAWPLWYFYELRLYFQEGEMLFRRGREMAQALLGTLEDSGSTADRSVVAGVLGAMLAYQAFFCFRQGHNVLSTELFQASIDLLRSLNEPSILAFALAHFGILCWLKGDFDEAHHHMSESLPLTYSIGDQWQIALFSTFLGMAVHEQGDFPRAYALLHDALQRCRALGDPRLVALASGYLSRTAHVQGRLNEMKNLLHEGLQAAKQTHDRWGVSPVLEHMALVARTGKDEDEVLRLFDESIELSRETGDWWSLSRVLNQAGYFALDQGDETRAHICFLEACQAAETAHVPPNALNALAGLAQVYLRQGKNEQAMELTLCILSDRASPPDTKHRAEGMLSQLERRLPAKRRDSIQKSARNMPRESMIQKILAASLEPPSVHDARHPH
jgi:predicted ATPase/transcriptional regulator with XRE-family HTH domain